MGTAQERPYKASAAHPRVQGYAAAGHPRGRPHHGVLQRAGPFLDRPGRRRRPGALRGLGLKHRFRVYGSGIILVGVGIWVQSAWRDPACWSRPDLPWSASVPWCATGSKGSGTGSGFRDQGSWVALVGGGARLRSGAAMWPLGHQGSGSGLSDWGFCVRNNGIGFNEQAFCLCCCLSGFRAHCFERRV